ncbi:MAG: AhpC/TSA family protein [Saprospiraceae bacterium]|jgi:peroxiredoxin|nr:AhpC/TSA family protein [Saprospiraceae bacterium]
MKKWLLFFFPALLAFFHAQAGEGGYNIRVKINGYTESNLFLAYHMADKQYIRDTVARGADGFFVFKGEEKLPGGVYLVVMAPDNQFFQLLISDYEQNFTLVTDKEKAVEKIKFEGAPDNTLFYQYINFLNNRRPLADTLKAQIDKSGDDAKKKEKLQKKFEEVNKEVEDYQKKIMAEQPKTLTAALIKANMPFEFPEFTGDSTEIQTKRWRYTQDHYFDNVDLTDPRLLRTPFLYSRIDYYVNKLQVQHPDTLSKATVYLLERLRPAEESFKFYLIHFLNQFAKSNIVGQDAVYVNLVDRYYATGLAPWTEEEQLNKILESAKTLKPLLIGKIAPNISLETRAGQKISLYDVKSEYTILYFWRYDCAVCKKSTPDLKAFYEKFKDKGVKIMAVCVKFTDEVPKCWEYVDENGTQDWLHCADPYNVSRYTSIYDTRSTPLIFVLDSKKEILSKRIAAEQLDDVMTRIIEMKKTK